MKVLEKVIRIIIFLIFVSYWPVKKRTIVLNSYLYIQEEFRFFDYITLANFLAMLLFILIPIYIFFRLFLKNKDVITINYIDITFFLFFLYRTLSTIFFFQSSKANILFRDFSIILIYCFYKCASKIKINKTIVIAGIVNCSLLFIQFIIYYNSLNCDFFKKLRLFRLSGGFRDPVVFSIFLVYSLSNLMIIKGELKPETYKICQIIFIITALATGSRGWIFIFIICAGIYCIQNFSVKKVIKIKVRFMIFNFIFILVFLFSSGLLGDYYENYKKAVFTNEASISSTNSRMSKAQLAYEIFKQNVVVGLGTDNYGNYNGADTNPHNIYLQVLAENGLVGVILMLMFLFALFKKCLHKENREDLIISLPWILGGTYIGLLSDFAGALCVIMMIVQINQKNFNSILEEGKI